MSVLVLAGNFLLMFVGWEGVGLASYLLIGFYFDRKSAANAGKKAFIVNRVGDFGFLIGIFLVLSTFGTLELQPNCGQACHLSRLARNRPHRHLSLPARRRCRQKRAAPALRLAA